jgi:predicted amidophosphoribosyltransferase
MFCGVKLDTDQFKVLDQTVLILCPHCGKNVPKTTFCILCGKNLDVIDVITPKEEISPSPEVLKCPLCRQDVPNTHIFCHICGGKLKKKTIDGQSQNTFCNQCMKPTPPDTEYCIHCGLKRQIIKTKLLEKPFEGYQLDLSHFFQPVSFPLSTLKQSLTASKDFPIKSTISHSKYFGVTMTRKGSFFYRNFGGFDGNNLLNYLATFVLMLLIYFFWYSRRYADLTARIDPVADAMLVTFFGGIFLTALLMTPTWLSTFMLYRNTGYKMNYRLNSSRVLITGLFNLVWILFPFFGPIILQLGDFKDPQERIMIHKSFIRGIAWGAVFTVSCTLILALLSLVTVGIPGTFAGFLFQNHPVKSHLITSYFGATWISLIILLPFGDYYDKAIKRWNQLGYIILLAIGLLLLTHSFNLMGVLTQTVYRA